MGMKVGKMSMEDVYRIMYQKLNHYHADATTSITKLGALFEQIITMKDAELESAAKKDADQQLKIKELKKKIKELTAENKKLKEKG